MPLRQQKSQKQHQRISLSLEARQGVEILSMTALEIRELLQNAFSENIFLQEAIPSNDFNSGFDLDPGSNFDLNPGLDWQDNYSFYDSNNEAYWQEDYFDTGGLTATDSSRNSSDPNAKDRMLERNISANTISAGTLQEHVEQIVRLRFGDGIWADIGEAIAGSMDDSGYLQLDVDGIAVVAGADIEQVKEVLSFIQHSDIPGIAARSVSECMFLQLEARGFESDSTYRVISNYFEDLIRGHLSKISKETGIEIQELSEIRSELALLDPRPGLTIGRDRPQIVIPEIRIDLTKDGLVVSLENPIGIRVEVNEEYAQLFISGAFCDKKADKKILNELAKQLKSARSLMENIIKRQQTLFEVASYAAMHQLSYFSSPNGSLATLKMSDVAEDLGLSVSTVSRIARTAYIKSPKGVISLRSLFVGGGISGGLSAFSSNSQDPKMSNQDPKIPNQDHQKAKQAFNKSDQVVEQISRDSVLAAIKELISTENRKKPLSDQQIASVLSQQGIPVSRRTVNKYRVGAGIPSQKDRRQNL